MRPVPFQKTIILILLAVLLTFALALVSCGSKCISGGGCYLSTDSSAYKWCGTSIKSASDRTKAVGCDVYKKVSDVALGKAKKASCDC